MVISINGRTVISSGFPLICADASMLKGRISSILIDRELHALKGPIIGALSDATPALLCHKEPARRKNTPIGGYFLLLAGSLWHKDRWLPCTERIY